jgi:hypothetical protein
MAVTPQKIGSTLYIVNRDVDPATASAALAAPDGVTTPWYLDMSLFNRGMVKVRPTVGDGFTLVRVFASTDIAGATSATLIRSSGAVVADALADEVAIEFSAEEIAALVENPDSLEPVPNVGLTYTRIIEASAATFALPVSTVLSNSRTRSVTAARSVAMFIMRRHLRMSFPQIADQFLMDHSSVQYAVKQAWNRLQPQIERTEFSLGLGVQAT